MLLTYQGEQGLYLKADSHVGDDFCEIKLFPCLVGKYTNICLIGALKWK